MIHNTPAMPYYVKRCQTAIHSANRALKTTIFRLKKCGKYEFFTRNKTDTVTGKSVTVRKFQSVRLRRQPQPYTWKSVTVGNGIRNRRQQNPQPYAFWPANLKKCKSTPFWCEAGVKEMWSKSFTFKLLKFRNLNVIVKGWRQKMKKYLYRENAWARVRGVFFYEMGLLCRKADKRHWKLQNMT